ncbi:alcohol dehydrogenase [Clostridia bacterium]|nr:alcohol dehydrogenase [Clostridia bacterium]
MKAAILRELGGKFIIEDISLAEPIGHEVLIDVKAVGLCHSDLHASRFGFEYVNSLPLLLGHEVAGVVIKVGSDVAEFRAGDPVAVSLIRSCGHCVPCRTGRPYQCKYPDDVLRRPDEPGRIIADGDSITQAFGVGGFAERVLVHENQLAKVPTEVPFPQAAILGCGVITGAGSAINTAKVRPGDTVAVVGLGGVGLNVISGARLAGAGKIIGIDIQPVKFELARRFGATDTVDSRDADAVKTILDLTGGGVDHCFEVIGLSETARLAIDITGVGGGVYIIGVFKPDAQFPIFPPIDMIGSQRKIQGVYMGSTDIKHDIPMYARLYLEGRLNLDDLVSREIRLDEINEAYADLDQGGFARTVITSF